MGAITGRLLTMLVLSAGLVAAGAVPGQSAVGPAPDIPVLTGICTGTHSTFDRIVLDLSGPQPQVSSRFVDALTRDGSGSIEWLPGAVFAEVHATQAQAQAQAHDNAGHSSYPGPRKFRTRNTLTGPTRVVIDVGH